ncbi:RNA polymerase sigma factor [Luteolibacter pohnpeiensis]|uniref:RNA polymerase sigma factor n=1 Tax=Luteolibacter pohnpeiensis TaxID=454153 RepID=A0A934S9U6_9BACT|nr:RNA polymerase sigma factor [Luteolibacter pohnpeiensis]MBK1883531.1 RNA polymerase sigma factor [Luteolibacter pohnpeiensis]
METHAEIPNPTLESSESFDERLAKVEHAIDSHGSYLLDYLTSLTKNRHDAEAIHSDLWVYVLHRFRSEHIEHLGALRRKAYQLFIDHYRKQRRNPVLIVEETPECPTQSSHEPYTDEEQAEFKARFFAEYQVDLPTEHQEALWLHAWCGYTFQEIAKIMGRPSSTIGDWITLARQAFADYLNSNPLN